MTAVEALNKLAKWRTIFTGWQLGTRAKGDPEGDAVRDHREATIVLRAEVSALAVLLVEKGIFTGAEWEKELIAEAQRLDRDYEAKFPGCRSTDSGMVITQPAAEYMRTWRP